MLHEPVWQYGDLPIDPRVPSTSQPSAFQSSILPMPYASPVPHAQTQYSSLFIDPLPPKSRVETQIPVKLTLFPLPRGVNSLHLQPYTISKSKLVAKPTPEKAADMFELFATLVCTSAMQDPARRALALVRAAGHPVSPVVEEDKALDVKICQGCIERERKRAARKKTKNVEEEELWQRDEAKRTIVFNTQEVKDWQQPPMPKSVDGTGQAMGFGPSPYPEGSMQVDIPMRIACVCCLNPFSRYSKRVSSDIWLVLSPSRREDRLPVRS